MNNIGIFVSNDKLFNARIKYYPTPSGDYVAYQRHVFSKAILNPYSVEAYDVDDGADRVALGEPECTGPDENKRSFYRARAKAYDYIMCNPDMNLFVTLTFSGETVRRNEYGNIIARLNDWLDNRVRRHGLKYLLVPEYHKDGENIHFHGFVNEVLQMQNSGHKRQGKTVYNITDFPFGFTTAIRRGKSDADVIRTAKYIFKYITKQGAVKIGGRYYLHGGKLEAPRLVYYHDVDTPTPYEVAPGLTCARLEVQPDFTLYRLSRETFGNGRFVALDGGV